jgi:YwiC-like protein
VQRTARPAPISRTTPVARRVPLVPKEHGASLMSAHALVLGIAASLAVGRAGVVGIALAVAIGASFVPLTAAISVLSHVAMRAAARRRAVALLAAECVLGVAALVHGAVAELLVVGAAGVPVALVYAVARRRTGARSVPTQLAAIAGISLLAPATWLLGCGARGAWPLSAAAAFLSFGGTVPYVRERVRRRRPPELGPADRIRRGAIALVWQAVALLAAIVVWRLGHATLLLPLAFVPGLVKTLAGIALPERKPPIAHIGYVETAVSTVFAVLAGLGLGLAL